MCIDIPQSCKLDWGQYIIYNIEQRRQRKTWHRHNSRRQIQIQLIPSSKSWRNDRWKRQHSVYRIQKRWSGNHEHNREMRIVLRHFMSVMLAFHMLYFCKVVVNSDMIRQMQSRWNLNVISSACWKKSVPMLKIQILDWVDEVISQHSSLFSGFWSDLASDYWFVCGAVEVWWQAMGL